MMMYSMWINYENGWFPKGFIKKKRMRKWLRCWIHNIIKIKNDCRTNHAEFLPIGLDDVPSVAYTLFSCAPFIYGMFPQCVSHSDKMSAARNKNTQFSHFNMTPPLWWHFPTGNDIYILFIGWVRPWGLLNW